MEQQPPEGLGSRDRILWAAASLLAEGPGAAVSVRSVAARAGVSTGSLRHHFPTQRQLMDAVLPLVYDLVLPQDSIHDTSIPARDRLMAALQHLLSPTGHDVDPRTAWIQAFDRYVTTEPTEAARAEYLGIERELHRRIEYALTVLQDEGSLPPGDKPRRARFLMTVLNGLSTAQAFPGEQALPTTQLEVLQAAVDCVFHPQW